MSRKLNNDFDSARLISLKHLEMAAEIPGRDHGGPYVVMQVGYDPADPTMTAFDFLLGRSGAWLATQWFFCLPVAERRQQYIFATAGEVIELMENLPHEVAIIRPDAPVPGQPVNHDDPLNQLVRSSCGDP